MCRVLAFLDVKADQKYFLQFDSATIHIYVYDLLECVLLFVWCCHLWRNKYCLLKVIWGFFFLWSLLLIWTTAGIRIYGASLYLLLLVCTGWCRTCWKENQKIQVSLRTIHQSAKSVQMGFVWEQQW